MSKTRFLRRLLLWSQVIRPIVVLQNIFVILAALIQVMVIPTETEVQTLVLAIPTELTEAISLQKVVYFLSESSF